MEHPAWTPSNPHSSLVWVSERLAHSGKIWWWYANFLQSKDKLLFCYLLVFDPYRFDSGGVEWRGRIWWVVLECPGKRLQQGWRDSQVHGHNKDGTYWFRLGEGNFKWQMMGNSFLDKVLKATSPNESKLCRWSLASRINANLSLDRSVHCSDFLIHSINFSNGEKCKHISFDSFMS